MKSTSHMATLLSKKLHAFIKREQLKHNSQKYSQYHKERFSFVINLCKIEKPDAATRVLDIGRSELTKLLGDYYVNVTVLGLTQKDEETFGEVGHLKNTSRVENSKDEVDQKFISYDLNDSKAAIEIPTNQKFDLIVFAEVIEHLIAMPEMVLGALEEILAPEGVILCQTPNAVALHKRLLPLFGRNPYERLRANFKSPGHFREYTKQELIEIGIGGGLSVKRHIYVDYFSAGGGWRGFAIRMLKLASFFWKPLSRGQTIIYKKL